MDINEQLKHGKETIAFRVASHCNDISGYGHIVLDVVYVKSDAGRYNDSIGFYDNYYDQKHQYKGLKVTCQMDKGIELPYSWRLIVDNCIYLSLGKAEEIVKTLRPIHRKMEKLCNAEGSVETFEEFVVRLVRVLNIKAFYARHGNDSQYKRNDNIGELRGYLQYLISENQNKLGFTKVS